MTLELGNLQITEVDHLPIIKEYAKKIKLVETVNQIVPSEMEITPGDIVLSLVVDTLSGRSPLYRLSQFYEDVDTEILFGKEINPSLLSDHNLARGMDKIFDAGTQKVFSQISLNAVNTFDVNTSGLHYDTTSVSVYGDYDNSGEPFEITYGYSKAKRPDLKQFLISMLCVDKNIPIMGSLEDGNASDKKLNNDVLSAVSKHMAKNGLNENAFIYTADSAMVTEDNLTKADSDGIKILSRLPATYNECGNAIAEAVKTDNWTEIGVLAESDGTKKKPVAIYKAWDTKVTLYEKEYRAVVIHSSAHDKRRHKRIDRILKKEFEKLKSVCKKISKTPFFCKEDAETAKDKLIKTKATYHGVNVNIEVVPKYGRGRPAKGQKRIPKRIEYVLQPAIFEKSDQLDTLRQGAGCFVLLTNLTGYTEIETYSSEKLLRLYKNQIGIEQNFGFLKDPVIVNSIFLKQEKRIEVLGLILLISLLIWRLMERSMRKYIQNDDKTITGWDNKQTRKPTSFMMTTKFKRILVAKVGTQRQLAKPLKPVHIEYLKALGLAQDIFTVP